MQIINLSRNNLQDFFWNGVSESLQEINLSRNNLQYFSWNGVSESLQEINLSENELIEFSWKGVSESLKGIRLYGNKLSYLNCHGMPVSLETMYVSSDTKIDFNYISWNIKECSFEFSNEYKRYKKDNYQWFYPTKKNIKMKKTLLDELILLALIPPNQNKLLLYKDGGVLFKEEINEFNKEMSDYLGKL